MRLRPPSLLLAASALFALCVPAAADPSAGVSRPSVGFFADLEPAYFQTHARSGGKINLRLDDSDTPGTDLSLTGGDGIDHQAHAPRVRFGGRVHLPHGFSVGGQARFMDLKDATTGLAPLTPGTTPLQNFATTSETNDLELYTGDVEAVVAYTRWGLTVEGTWGTRSGRFRSESEIEVFGVFTSGNFVQLQFSNGSAFEGDGQVKGYSVSYRVPRVPVSLFAGRRYAELDGETDSFGRVVGTVASSPSAPLVGAATVRRDNARHSTMITGETRLGLQAELGSPGGRVRSFARLSYERLEFLIDGPPTGGAGFGGTLNDLTTNGFSSAGLGDAWVDGWSLAVGVGF